MVYGGIWYFTLDLSQNINHKFAAAVSVLNSEMYIRCPLIFQYRCPPRNLEAKIIVKNNASKHLASLTDKPRGGKELNLWTSERCNRLEILPSFLDISIYNDYD